MRKLEDHIADLEGQLITQPQPVIKRLSLELQRAHQTIARRTDELRQAHQLNHPLRQRSRALEHALEHGEQPLATPVKLAAHNSHQPPASAPPGRKVEQEGEKGKNSPADWRHPYYWASFIQSGAWTHLDGK